MRFALPAPVARALDALNAAGFEAYIVGGCVRDDALNIPPHDYDVTTSALPAQIKAVFSLEKCILAGEKHGTITVLLDGTPLEITTFRTDGEYMDARHPSSVTFTTSLKEDLARRDFTINAMAFDRQKGLVDPFGGQEDLARGVIRCVGEASKRLSEDALRILRGLRFAARLGFLIEPETAAAMHALRGLLQKVSRERIAAELTGLLCGRSAAKVLRAFPDVLFAAIPELSPLVSCPQNSVYHMYDVWEHTLHALDAVTPRTPLTVWSALLHDCGKPAVHTQDERGFDHFAGHQQAGEKIAREILRSLKMSNQMVDSVCTLVLYHDDLTDESKVRPLLAAVKPALFDDLLALRRADLLAHAPFVQKKADSVNQYRAKRDEILRLGLCFTVSGLRVNGDDLKRLGYQGKEIGEALALLLNKVMRDELPNTREALLLAAEKK